MKSLEELARIREEMKDKVILREGAQGTRIVVCMGTSGIAAGARDVLNTLVAEVANGGLMSCATVLQSGSANDPAHEPVVEVIETGKEKVTYVNMTPERACRVVAEHIKGGKPVTEYTI